MTEVNKRKPKKITTKVLDKAFSLFIRKRDGQCMRCGAKDKPLFCAHYHSRVAMSVRWSPFNAISCCYGCHRFLESRKTVEHKDLMYKVFGRPAMDKLEKEYRKLKIGGFSEKEKIALLGKFK